MVLTLTNRLFSPNLLAQPPQGHHASLSMSKNEVREYSQALVDLIIPGVKERRATIGSTRFSLLLKFMGEGNELKRSTLGLRSFIPRETRATGE